MSGRYDRDSAVASTAGGEKRGARDREEGKNETIPVDPAGTRDRGGGAGRPGLEAQQADQRHRALGRRRLDRPDHPGRRGRSRRPAGTEGRHHQPGGRRRARSAPRASSTRPRTATPGPPAPRRTSAPTRSRACSTRRSDDWLLFLTVANISIVGVNANAPYKDLRDSSRPSRPSRARSPSRRPDRARQDTSPSSRSASMCGIEYKHVTYDGGNPAVIACVAGEAEVAPQLAVEEADMLRGGKLRALAVLDDKPLTIKGCATADPADHQLARDYKPRRTTSASSSPRTAPPTVVESPEQGLGQHDRKSPEAPGLRPGPRRRVRPVLRRCRPEGVFGYLQHGGVALLRRRQGQDVARRGRHTQAVAALRRGASSTGRARTAGCRYPRPSSSEGRLMKEKNMPRADFVTLDRADRLWRSPSVGRRSPCRTWRSRAAQATRRRGWSPRSSACSRSCPQRRDVRALAGARQGVPPGHHRPELGRLFQGPADASRILQTVL